MTFRHTLVAAGLAVLGFAGWIVGAYSRELVSDQRVDSNRLDLSSSPQFDNWTLFGQSGSELRCFSFPTEDLKSLSATKTDLPNLNIDSLQFGPFLVGMVLEDRGIEDVLLFLRKATDGHHVRAAQLALARLARSSGNAQRIQHEFLSNASELRSLLCPILAGMRCDPEFYLRVLQSADASHWNWIFLDPRAPLHHLKDDDLRSIATLAGVISSEDSVRRLEVLSVFDRVLRSVKSKSMQEAIVAELFDYLLTRDSSVQRAVGVWADSNPTNRARLHRLIELKGVVSHD